MQGKCCAHLLDLDGKASSTGFLCAKRSLRKGKPLHRMFGRSVSHPAKMLSVKQTIAPLGSSLCPHVVCSQTLPLGRKRV